MIVFFNRFFLVVGQFDSLIQSFDLVRVAPHETGKFFLLEQPQNLFGAGKLPVFDQPVGKSANRFFKRADEGLLRRAVELAELLSFVLNPVDDFFSVKNG